MNNLKIRTLLVVLVSLLTYNLMAQQILPQPTSITEKDGFFTFNESTSFYTNLEKNDAERLFQQVNSTAPNTLKKAKKQGKNNFVNFICTQKNDDNVALDNAELQAYKLEITPQNIIVEAPSAMGLFYAWQSVRQMINNDGKVKCAVVDDSPRFTYRGVMIDCSRHFWTVEHIKKQIDIMAYLKLDRLHLHLTDAAGWRIEIKKYPELTEKGAYRTASNWKEWWTHGDKKYCTKDAEGAYGGYYTQEQLKDIVAYAADRFIIVIPEVEMPGHSEEAIFAYPELSCKGEPYSAGELCIGKEFTFEFLENVLDEVMEIFPSEYIHIGGDEASRKVWESCPHCKKRMTAEGLKTTAELQSYLTQRIEKYLNAHGRQLLGWDEILEGELAPNATVMSWRGEEGGIKAANMGHKVIMTPGKYCYIDSYQDAPLTQPLAFGNYLPLDRVHSYNPISEEMKNNGNDKYIYGVQANLWTELVETPEYLEYMLYPRVLAIAEVGWSKNKPSYQDFRTRTLKVLEYMKTQGYNTFDLANEIGHRSGSVNKINHEGLGKKVKYITPYNNSYIGSGDESLTNGFLGDWNFNDTQWQGFISGGRFEVVVDMDSICEIRDISLEFLQFLGPEIYFPSEVEFSVSNDGENFTTLQKSSYQFEDIAYLIREYAWKGETKGRYIRCVAKRSVKRGWLFTNELIINRK